MRVQLHGRLATLVLAGAGASESLTIRVTCKPLIPTVSKNPK